MAEQIQNSTVTPSAVLAAQIVSPATTGSVVSAANLPSSGTFSLVLKGTAADGSDDGIIAVGAITGTALSSITWVRNGQGTFPADTEVEYDLDARALIAYVAEQIATHAADTTGVHGIADTAALPAKLLMPYLHWQASAATTGNITLAGEQTIDAVAVTAGMTVLVKDQTDPSENGIYVVSAGSWSRHAYFNTDETVYRSHLTVNGGTANTDKVFGNANTTPAVLGTDDVTYVEIGANGSAIDVNSANRMAVDLMGLIFGDVSINGAWSFNNDLYVGGELNIGALPGITVITPDLIGLEIAEGLTTGDGDLALLLSNDVSTLYVAGPKIQTVGDVELELKSGYGSTTQQSYIYLNGGQRVKMVYKSANYTVDIGDHEIIYTTLSAARTDTLPLLSTIPDGWWCVFGDGTSAGAAGTYNLIIKEHATDGGSEVARLVTNNAFVKVKKINGKWWRGPYEAWTRTA